MINFADEWTVRALADYKQSTVRNEARQYRLMQDIRSHEAPTTGLRQTVGLKMVQLGQQILGQSL